MNITTIRVTQQVAPSQLHMVVKSHITAAMNSENKSSESMDSSTKKDYETDTAPKWTNGAMV